MHLDLTADQELFRSTAARFLDRESDTATLRALSESPSGFTREWWTRAAELGWTGLLVSEALGGASVSTMPVVDASLIAEEAGRRAAPGPIAMTHVSLLALSTSANAQSHAGDIDKIVSGASVATWAVYEPGHGWQPLNPTLEATPISGGYRLTGVKDRVEAGDQADVFLVTASLDGSPTQFIVPANARGLMRERMWSLDFTRHFARVTFDGVLVPAQSRVGGGHADGHSNDRQLIARQCQVLAALQCAETLGVTERVFAMTLEWAFARVTFGRVLASYQAIKHRFAVMRMMLEGMRATTESAARAIDTNSPDARQLALVANIYVSSRAVEIIQECVQLHGGIGVTWEHDLHLFLRRATVNRAFYGSPEELRSELGGMLAEGGLP